MEAIYHQKATMGKRVVALLLDGVFMNIILSLVFFLLGWNVYVVLTSVAMLLYFGILEGSGMHATLGKYILGLIVVDEDGVPITYSQSFLRALCRYVSGLALGIGYFVAFGDPRGRTWHDKWAHTFVAARVASYAQPQPIHYTDATGSAQLVGVSGLFAGRSYPITGQGLLIGRDQTTCDVVFPDNYRGISRTHCKVQYNPQTRTVVLHDLGSHYGTYTGSGVRLRQGSPVALRSGDEFYLADRNTAFRIVI